LQTKIQFIVDDTVERRSFRVFLVKNYGWGCDLLYQKPLSLALIIGLHVVVYGSQVRSKTLLKKYQYRWVLPDCVRHWCVCGEAEWQSVSAQLGKGGIYRSLLQKEVESGEELWLERSSPEGRKNNIGT
jgi:hypothetical protein